MEDKLWIIWDDEPYEESAEAIFVGSKEDAEEAARRAATIKGRSFSVARLPVITSPDEVLTRLTHVVQLNPDGSFHHHYTTGEGHVYFGKSSLPAPIGSVQQEGPLKGGGLGISVRGRASAQKAAEKAWKAAR